MVALNAKTKEVITTLNAEIEDATLNVDLKTDDGSERRNCKVMMALNAELKTVITTLNAKTKDATLNVDLKTDDGSECRN